MGERVLKYIPIPLGLLYVLVYLYVIGDLDVVGPPWWGIQASDLSLQQMLSSRSTLLFESVAVIEAGYLIWLVSPVNLMIAFLMGGLLAANLHGALFLRQRSTCGIDSTTASRGSNPGIVGGVLPALLAGGACCAPSLILLLGIPGLGAMSAFFGWLVPLSVLILGINRLWQHRLGAPPLFSFSLKRAW